MCEYLTQYLNPEIIRRTSKYLIWFVKLWALIFDSNFDLIKYRTQIFDLTFDLVLKVTFEPVSFSGTLFDFQTQKITSCFS